MFHLDGQKVPTPWIDGDMPVAVLQIKGDEPRTWTKGQVDLGDCYHLEWLNKAV